MVVNTGLTVYKVLFCTLEATRFESYRGYLKTWLWDFVLLTSASISIGEYIVNVSITTELLTGDQQNAGLVMKFSC
jgi:hypothetical protein